jgi:hypothetical protein
VPNLAALNVLQCQFYCQEIEQVSINTFNYLVTSVGPSPATDADAAATLSTLFAPDFKALVQNNGTYLGVLVRVRNILPLPSPAGSTNGTGAGTAGAVGLPRQSAGLLSFQTGFAGPGKRGRMYLPFPSVSDNQLDGGPSPGYVTKGETLGADLMGPVPISVGGRTATLEPVLWSKKEATYFSITSFHMSPSWATIRRRGSFGRPNSNPFA